MLWLSIYPKGMGLAWLLIHNKSWCIMDPPNEVLEMSRLEQDTIKILEKDIEAVVRKEEVTKKKFIFNTKERSRRMKV